MPKKRHAAAKKSPPKNTQPGGAAVVEETALHPARLIIGALALLLAIIAGVFLAWSEMGGDVPGCGVDAACSKAADSVFGSLPGIGWPVSFLGLAYFIAMGVAWPLHRRGVNVVFKAMASLGGLSSLFYAVVIITNIDEYLCPWCITSHLANFVFVATALTTRNSNHRSGAFTVAVAGVAFVVATTALAGANAVAQAKIAGDIEDEEQLAGESIARRSPEESPAVRTAPDVPAAGSTLPAGWVEGPVPEVGEVRSGLPAEAFKTDDKGFTGRYRLGPREARFRVVAFSSYQCEHCAVFEEEIFQLLAERDDISFSHRHFPLDTDCNPHLSRTRHRQSCEASALAEATGLIYGPAAFWEIHKFLFDRIRADIDTPIDLPGEFRARGYDFNRVRPLIETAQVVDYIERDADTAYALGLRQTPFVFVNGVEINYRTRDSLRRVIQQAESRGVEPGTALADTPIGAIEKFVRDFAQSRTRVREMGQDLTVSHFGPQDAPVRMQVFLCVEDERSVPVIDSLLTLADRYGDQLRITFRHFPLNEQCNIFADTQRSARACEMHLAIEAAARLGGNEAFETMFRWMHENRADFGVALLDEAATAAGLDPEALRAEMSNDELRTAILRDAQFLQEQRLRAVRPVIYLNDRRVTTYEFEGESLGVLDGVVRSELGLNR